MTAPHRIFGSLATDCEILIIGSGAGGATLAHALTAAGRDVLMLEEGPYIAAEDAPPSVPEAFKKMWRGGGLTVALGNPPVAYAEGRCVGGGTEINSAIMQRTPDDLLDQWARRYAIRDYGPAPLAPYYEQAEKLINASLTEPPLGRASDLLREGGEKLGWEVTPLKRAQKNCVGTNLCAAACPTGGKQSMTAALLPVALANGLRLIAECRVTKLGFKGNKIAKVNATARDAEGRSHRVTIRPRQVFVCAGAIHTPALLMRSGVRENIGRTLRLHPTAKITARFSDKIDAENARLPLYAITEFMPDQRLGGSVFLPGFFGMALAEDWKRRAHLWEMRENTAIYYAMARAGTVGSVQPLPGMTEPLVRYQCAPEDLANLQQGLGRLAEAMFAAGAVELYPSIAGHEGWRSLDEVRRDRAHSLSPSALNLMTIHMFSSCPSGERREICATDSYGRVHGFANLFVADASQIPEAPGVNPQLTIMALALRNAEMFLSQTTQERARAAS
jgi:choline dehydrogenase-like flavoprotein